MRTLFNQYLKPGDKRGFRIDEGTTTAPEAATVCKETHAPPHTCRCNPGASDPTSSVCRFSNSFNNCWMNASLQAVLNLGVVREKLADLPAEPLTRLSATPAFAELFLTALKHPGRAFSSLDLCHVLKELSANIPHLSLFGQNDPVELLEPFLTWLRRCGVDTTLEVQHRCAHCGVSAPSSPNPGNIYFLPRHRKHYTICDLLKRAVLQSRGSEPCEACGSTERGQVWSCPDVLTCYLPPSDHSGAVDMYPATPPELMEFTVDENTTHRYRLSSVICHGQLTASEGHYWSYLLKDHCTIKANSQIVKREDMPDKIFQNGVIYIYEKCT